MSKNTNGTIDSSLNNSGKRELTEEEIELERKKIEKLFYNETKLRGSLDRMEEIVAKEILPQLSFYHKTKKEWEEVKEEISKLKFSEK